LTDSADARRGAHYAPAPRRAHKYLAGVLTGYLAVGLSVAVNLWLTPFTLRFLDRELKDNLFVCGEHYTIADITGLVAVDFMKPAKLAVPEELRHVRRWHGEVSARPSASA
jgi:hypothetical protein